MNATPIVGYTYRADQYCTGHIVAQLTANPGNVHHAEAVILDVEAHLDLLARLEGIDRYDEHSFDSDHFPKVIYASQVEGDDDRCGTCGEPLID